ncbi:hypothetical protein QTP70_024455 [Hemibagrus guttatus]|uniref:Tensin-2-like n=1 Tax=Hemibagrus guttatus TaxID=175788 RepID=A0AAE0RLM9_9TELE|nr:hypothetical protein QTP70_024455 [Hemibagrus guttatus]
MGCVFSKRREVEERVLHLTDGPQTRDCNEDAEILSLTEVGTQSFKGGKLEKKHHCSVCKQILDSDGACYRECKSSVNSNSEAKCKAPAPHSSKTQSKAPLRTDSVDKNVMENVMESLYDFDLIYITERIISVFFLPDLDEQRYRRNLKEVAAMLKSKHQEKFMVINLSEKRHDISRLNPKVEEFGWPDLHAPPLDKICTVCKTMEGWLNSDPRNVVVLHCKGNRGKTGVIIAAYMHFSKISAGADHALTTIAMRKFCEDKISSSLQPSQNRYIYYFSGLLSGAIKINSSSLLLQQVHIPAITNYKPGEAYAPFLKIYQSLKLVYTSGIYETNSSMNRMLGIKIEPALLLKGDIMVKCYHRRAGLCERECVFRVQFHTCTVHGSQLWFGKKELDHACTDKRYPADATVELVFSSSPEQKRGEEIPKKDPGGSPDISCTDSVVRWDSYENFNFHHEDSIEDICHTRGPLDGSLYAQVKKRRGPGSTSNNPPVINASTPSQLPYISSDSEVSDKHSKMKIPHDVTTKEDCNNSVALQVQNSEGPPVEPEESVNCDVAHRDCPPNSSTSTELTKEPQECEAKNPHVTESTSTTILISEPSESSQTLEPQVTALGAESLGSVTQVLGNTPLTPENENNSTCPSERSSFSELLLLGPSSEVQSLTPLIDRVSYHEDGSNNDLRASSPVPDGYITPLFPLASHNYPLLTVPHHPYTGYTAITIPSYPPQPPLPEKQRVSPLQDSSTSSSSVRSSIASSTSSFQSPITLLSTADTRQKVTLERENRVSAKFVQDTSKFWYKPGISRDQAIAVLKDKEPGYFLIRDSSSFQGAYGLALKVATPPAHVSNHGHTSHSQEQLVRHFLIESGSKGVKIKGCQNEMYFGSLSALVYQHSITPVSLPCKLHIPDKDLVGELQELQSDTNTSTAAELLKQGAACNVLYINSVDTESLTGPQAISRAVKCTRAQKPCPSATAVHFKVSSQGITLTDNQRRLFFRRHYPVYSVIFSCVAPEDQRWTAGENSSNRMFGFVARRSGSSLGNVCHLFAELDPEQPAMAIVNFINKVMLGPHQIRK